MWLLILQGGMAWVSEAKLAAAVSNAGGAVYAGQSLTVINKIEPCSIIIEKIIREAIESIKAAEVYL